MYKNNICRVCLINNVDTVMYRLANTEAREFYEKLINSELDDGLPETFCYICYSLLRKCKRFADIVIKSQQILTQLLHDGIEITAATLPTLHSHRNNYKITKTECVSIDSCIKTIDTNFEPYCDMKQETNSTDDERDEELAGINSGKNKKNYTNNDNRRKELTESFVVWIKDNDSVKKKSKLIREHPNNKCQRKTAIKCYQRKTKLNNHKTKEKPQNETSSTYHSNDCCKMEISYEHESKSEINSTKQGNYITDISLDKHKRSPGENDSKHIMDISLDQHNYSQTELSLSKNNNTITEISFDQNDKSLTQTNPLSFSNDTISKMEISLPLNNQKITELSFNSTETKHLTRSFEIHNDKNILENDKLNKFTQLLTCNICRNVSSTIKTYERHIKSHSEVISDKRPYKCKDTKYKSFTEISFHNHNKRSLNKTQLSNGKCEISLNEDDKMQVAKFPCGKFPTYKTNCHTKSIPCKKCEFTCKDVKIMRMHKKEKHRPHFSCKNCDFKCNEKRQLHLHINEKHSNVPIYSCKLCDFKSTLKRSLTTHTRHEHDAYNCFKCDFKCKKKKELQTHLLTLHNEVKAYACEKCSYKTNERSALVNHSIIHNNEKSYICDICDFRCKFRQNLICHMTLHFGVKTLLCQYCGQTFKTKHRLKQHSIIHFGDKRFTCDLCDFKCYKNSVLKRHARVHTGEKPFECQICTRKFTRRANLRLHIAKLHSESSDALNNG